MRRGFRPRFFVDLPAPGASAAGGRLVLPADDAHHARAVLRARPGDPCEVVLLPVSADAAGGPASLALPGPGLLAVAHFVDVGRDVAVELDQTPRLGPADRVNVVICQALPRPGRVDEVLEKGTEVGVASFVLFPTDGSPSVAPEGLRKRAPRWERICREAAKQSKQWAVPSVVVAASVSVALALVASAGLPSLVFEPSGGVGVGPALSAAMPGALVAGGIALWVGPEGGWSAAEVAQFGGLDGVSLASLGGRILRTETAGPVVAALAHFVAGDW